MKITKEERLCDNCKYWDIMTGYCSKHKHHTHGHDQVCEQWKKHDDFIEHGTRKKKEYKQLTLFEEGLWSSKH